MWLVGLATFIPILMGLATNHLEISVLGSVVGFLVALNDHFGKWGHRLWVMSLTYLLILFGFFLGTKVGEGPLFWLTLGGSVYWMGVLSGQGAELEKGFTFGLVGFLVAQASPELPSEVLPALFLFVVSGYLTLLLAIPLLALLGKLDPKPYRSLRESLSHLLSKRIQNHIHAASFTVAVLFAARLVLDLHLERGYWVTITVLLVMRPDRTQSIQIILQRLIGTLLGVLAAELILLSSPPIAFLIAVTILCASAVPWASLKNYAGVAFFATVMVVLLLELNQIKQGFDTHLPWVRLLATAMGCAISLIGTLISKILDTLILKKPI